MVAGGLITASAGGFAVAAVGRLLSGIGAVAMNILLSKMVADWFAGKDIEVRGKPQTIGDLKDAENVPLSDHDAIALDFVPLKR